MNTTMRATLFVVLLAVLCGCPTLSKKESVVGLPLGQAAISIVGYYSTEVAPELLTQWFTVRKWIELSSDGRYASGHQHYVDGAPTAFIVEVPAGGFSEGSSKGSWRLVDDRLHLKSDFPVYTNAFGEFAPGGVAEALIIRKNDDWLIEWDHNEFVRTKPPNKSSDSTTSAGTSAAGQPRVPASAASHL